MWNPEKVAAVAREVLVEYLGVAAQFVVEDALAMSKDALRNGGENEELHMYTFLINLSNLLPPSVPTEKIRETIRKKYHGK